MTDFPELAAPRMPWVMTLADLALLLVGFLLLVQATASGDRKALAAGLREGFGAAPVAALAPAMPVAAVATGDFATGSAQLADDPALVAWTREAIRDPRVTLAIVGAVDGSAGDVDAATGSAAVLAADRARSVATQLAGVIPARRLTVATTNIPGRRAASISLAFTGEAK